ncbi:peptidoglycan-N-acetylmuramic acid deacetylase [Paenibacillus sp. 1_12]|uniref:delta-lactam-biosynthetic de-N-acetylase n=1 Tax=Paenibacillus sp. 1_12 TaxID=1566278 RepID=UPI0008E1608B|nr:polysaccharide deacetylase family protein [Paenibacillus sp. 1_12]SFL25128.1 peptidoglycan-N-acetylmuramic acid deacetylase [Paenibacillus sp. 1_12]
MMTIRSRAGFAALTVILCGTLLAACSGTSGSKEAAQQQAEAVKSTPSGTETIKEKPVPTPELLSAPVELSPIQPPADPVEPPVQPPLKQPSNPVAAIVGNGGDSGYGGASASTTVASNTYKPRQPITNDRKDYSWYYMKQPKGKVPNFPNETNQYTDNMKALWVGTGKKVYLTIDTGGPMGDTELLIKSLKDNNAKANFFIAGYNVKKDPDFVRRLVEDGHLVANHTMTHTDMNLQTDEQVKKEIHDYEKLYKEVTGKEIQPYFRFPYGRYNMHLLSMVSDMGYTSVFWSTAMKDWVPRANGAEDPYNDIMGNLHDGNIVLIHQGSPENIEALDRIIKGIRKAGYELALLTDIQPPSR